MLARLEPSLERICCDLEAFATPAWAARAILKVELLTPLVLDPCCGLGTLRIAAEEASYSVLTSDIRDWSQDFTDAKPPTEVADFLTDVKWSSDGGFSVFMNPPFSKACAFIDQAFAMGARKIVCFQRWAWRESRERRAWWSANPPARLWLCADRATCWRFDLPEDKRRSSSTYPHAWFVWEAGHKGAEIVQSIWKDA